MQTKIENGRVIYIIGDYICFVAIVLVMLVIVLTGFLI